MLRGAWLPGARLPGAWLLGPAYLSVSLLSPSLLESFWLTRGVPDWLRPGVTAWGLYGRLVLVLTDRGGQRQT